MALEGIQAPPEQAPEHSPLLGGGGTSQETVQTPTDSSTDCQGPSDLELGPLPSAGCCFVLCVPSRKLQLPSNSPAPALPVCALTPGPGHGALSAAFVAGFENCRAFLWVQDVCLLHPSA